jgi:hypothetical protein
MNEDSLLHKRVQAGRKFPDQIANKSQRVRRQYLFETLDARRRDLEVSLFE